MASPRLPDDGRVALYYAPSADDPLFAAGARWLGRDPTTGLSCPQPNLPDIAEVTAEPRHYGFHATLKPPMLLLSDLTWPDLHAATQALANSIAPFDLPPLTVADLHGFLAVREQHPSPALQSLADRCVEALDRFRAPPTETEIARRLRANLSPAHKANLVRWGYPYVFGEWFFHMTLTRRLNPAEHAFWRPATQNHFATALHHPRRVTDICLFTQPTRETPFTLAARFPLRG